MRAAGFVTRSGCRRMSRAWLFAQWRGGVALSLLTLLTATTAAHARAGVALSVACVVGEEGGINDRVAAESRQQGRCSTAVGPPQQLPAAPTAVPASRLACRACVPLTRRSASQKQYNIPLLPSPLWTPWGKHSAVRWGAGVPCMVRAQPQPLLPPFKVGEDDACGAGMPPPSPLSLLYTMDSGPLIMTKI
eukprot:365313-Chlamydomonas_euryale.AAC.11